MNHKYFLRKKTAFLKQYLVGQSWVLNVGCGQAETKAMVDCNIIGLDVKWNPSLDIQADCAHLPFKDNSFDIVFSMCLFHHLPLLLRGLALDEMKRVTKELVVCFDHNPWNPITRLITKKCPLDQDSELLSKGEMCDLFLDSGLEISRQSYIVWGGQYAVVGVKQ